MSFSGSEHNYTVVVEFYYWKVQDHLVTCKNLLGFGFTEYNKDSNVYVYNTITQYEIFADHYPASPGLYKWWSVLSILLHFPALSLNLQAE